MNLHICMCLKMLRSMAVKLLLPVFLIFTLTAVAQPKASFTASKYSGCAPQSISFTNTSTGATSYQWTFGNGNQSILKDPSATYIKAGKYTVLLVAIGSGGQTDTASAVIEIFANPTANFKVDISKGCASLVVNFTDLSVKGSANITNYLWDFGDGGTSTSANPKHTYTLTGKFDVTLIVTDANGCNSTFTRKAYIVIPQKASGTIKASDSMSCAAPLSVTFTTNASSPIGGPLKYFWEFGDGATDTKANPTHIYQVDGIYTVKLTVTDTGNCSTTFTKFSYIRIGKEKANFSFSPQTGCPPLKVTFTNTTSPGASGSTYQWKFGDGGTSADQNPEYTYNTSGTYKITLVVKSAAGCIDSITKSLTTATLPKVSFTSADTLGCRKNTPVKFTNNSDGTVVKWDFGDNTTSTDVNPTHTYKDTGTYTVSLTMKSASGCMFMLVKKDFIKIHYPIASITAPVRAGCIPLKVNFTDGSKSVVPITKWFWDFDDGTTSTSKDPGIHTFKDEGFYDVKLVITTANGCKDSFIRQIKAGTRPKADFDVSRRKGCISEMKVNFYNYTNNYTVKADSFHWDFGDGGTSDKYSPEYQYDVKKGKYTVSLWAGNKGCKDSLIMTDYIEILPPWASFNFTYPKCNEDSIFFTDGSVGADKITWRFGDGTTSNAKNPVKKIPPGTYTVVQEVYNDSTKCIDTFYQIIHIDPFVANAKSNKTSGCSPLTIKFNATANREATWYWDFGDGTTSTEKDVTHTFSQRGKFAVKLVGTNINDSCTSISILPDSVFVYGPEPKFTVDAEGGCVPFKVKITDSSSSIYTLNEKYFDMGDGTILPAGAKTFEYTYKTPPLDQINGYTITLVMKDKAGCVADATHTVYPTHPRPNFYFNREPYCGAVKYTFVPMEDAFNGKGPFKYEWQLGDTVKIYSATPEKIFTKSGTFIIKLKITDANGCSDTTSQQINLDIRFPKAKLSASPLDADCPPVHIKFKDETQLGLTGIKRWYWDFGDGTYSELQNPEKIYLTAGKFTIKLYIEDSVGCFDTAIAPSLVVIRGPIGTFKMDKSKGCQPLTVNFTATSKNASSYAWDMGDGTIKNGAKVTHQYPYAGTFIPLLILSDSFGCTYTLPPIDTIIVHPQPVSNFNYMGSCFDYPTQFTDYSDAVEGYLTKWRWNFDDGGTSMEQNPDYIFKKPGFYNVSLTVTNTGGCETTITKKIKMGGLDAKFSPSSQTGCIGQPIKFTDETLGDTTLNFWQWSFGDGTTSTEQNPIHTFLKKGYYYVKLMAGDVAGCVDTFVIQQYLIGDTTPPPAPDIYRVTVETDNVVRLDFASYNEIDFFKYYIYRQDPGGSFKVIDSLSNFSDTTYMDSSVNALHNVYRYKVVIKTVCGYYSQLNTNPHATVELTAKPAINAAILTWNFYEGWDSVLRYEVYRENVYSPGSYYMIGSVKGNVKTFIDTGIICYRTHTYRVKAIQNGGYKQVSWSDTSTTTPVYIPDVPANILIRATVKDDKFVLLEWTDVPGLKLKNFVIERSTDGINYQQLGNPLQRPVYELIDTAVDVHNISYFYRMYVVDSCGDNSPFTNLGKTILLKVDTTAELRPQLRWTKYRDWSEGVLYYDIERKNTDGTFTKIDQTASGADTIYIDNITDLNSQPYYCYRVIAHRKGVPNWPTTNPDIISTSNEDCAKVRSIIHVPNVFTPNRDSTNDAFLAVGIYVKTFKIKIYDRWGTLVYEGDDIHKGWDGKYKGANPVQDAYRWIIYAKGADNKVWYLQGWINVMP